MESKNKTNCGSKKDLNSLVLPSLGQCYQQCAQEQASMIVTSDNSEGIPTCHDPSLVQEAFLLWVLDLVQGKPRNKKQKTAMICKHFERELGFYICNHLPPACPN